MGVFMRNYVSFIYCLKMSRASKNGRSNPTPIFINKLHSMIEDQENLDTISWTSDQDSFCIKNISKFTDDVLPIYFKHRNFASFIRQLNMYGFRKIRHSQGDNVYMHQNFKANAKHLLKHITRRIKQDKEQELEVQRNNRHVEPQVSRQIQELRGNQKNLEELCRHFIEQNQRLLLENQNIVRRMEEEDREKERKLEELLVFLLTQKDSKSLMSGKNEGMLSITNQSHNQDSYSHYTESPLQAIGNALDSDGNIHKARQLIQGIYSKKKNKTQNNFSINDPNHQQTTLNDPLSHPIEVNQQPTHSRQLDQPVPAEDKSFLSINDFLNVNEEHQPFNLQDSF